MRKRCAFLVPDSARRDAPPPPSHPQRTHACSCRPPRAGRLWCCHAPEPRRRRGRLRALDEDIPGTQRRGLAGCGVREDDKLRRGRPPVALRRRCRRGGQPDGEAGGAAQPAGEAARVQRAERPEERALPAASELPVQRAGETARLGVHLPRVRVSPPPRRHSVSAPVDAQPPQSQIRAAFVAFSHGNVCLKPLNLKAPPRGVRARASAPRASVDSQLKQLERKEVRLMLALKGGSCLSHPAFEAFLRGYMFAESENI